MHRSSFLRPFETRPLAGPALWFPMVPASFFQELSLQLFAFSQGSLGLPRFGLSGSPQYPLL